MVEYEKDAIVQPYVTEYIRSSLKKRNGLMEELEEIALKRDIPIVQPETAKLLETLIMTKFLPALLKFINGLCQLISGAIRNGKS